MAEVHVTGSREMDAANGVSPLARPLLALAVVGMGLAFGGLFWDGVWHTTFPFEDFWAPPHIVLYAGLALVLLINLAIFHRPFRDSFTGLQLKVPFLSFRLAAPLVLLAVGSLMAIFSGMVDQKWHETLQGGESAYSLPHNFTILGGMLAALGVVGGILHLRDARENRNLWAIALFGAVLVMVMYRLVYSFAESAAGVERAMADPLLASDPNAQALRARYLETNLLADNTVVAPVFLVVAALFPLAFARGLSAFGAPRLLRSTHQASSSADEVAVTGDKWAATRIGVLFAAVGMALTFLFLAQGFRPVRSSPVSLAVLPAAIAADLSLRALSRYDGGRGAIFPMLARSLRLRARSEKWRVAMNGENLSWPIAAAIYLAGYGALFGLHPAGVALALAGGGLAGFMGRGLARVVHSPTPRAVAWTLLWMGLIIPVALSSLDFYLRWPLLGGAG